MPKDEKEYSTEKAWNATTTNSQADMFRSLR
jgi:hypothetical protein